MSKSLFISKRAKIAPASPIRKLTPLAEKAKEKGIKVYHLNIGQPDFEIPLKIRRELKKLVSTQKVLVYSPSLGEKVLIDAWREYYQQVGIKLSERDILVTSGGSEALILAMAAISDPQDEFLVFEPFYPNYSGFASLLSVKVVPVALDKNNGYHLPLEKSIVSKITQKTKAILFTNPNNPTGTVFTPEEINTIIKIGKRYQLFVVGDETYRGICFDGKKSFSFLQLAKEKEKQQIIIIDSLSKRLNICGARIGALISKNQSIMEAVNRFAQARLSVATLEQLAVAPILKKSLGYVASLSKKYQKRRNVFLSTLEKELKIKIHKPEGAFYTMLSLPIKNAEDFSRWLLTDFQDKKETVMVAPGPGFYATQNKGKNEVRVAYVLCEKNLKRAAELLSLALKKYQNLKSLHRRN